MNTHHSESAPSKLAIFSPARSLEHIELCRTLGTQLSEHSCELCSNPNSVDSNTLIIFDSAEISAPRIEHWLLDLNQRNRVRLCALIKVETGSLHEELMDWPHVVGIFPRDSNLQQMAQGLSGIFAGKLSLPERLYQKFVRRLRRPPACARLNEQASPLTRREIQILEGIYSGFSNARIADRLALSEHTIKSHLSNAYRKLGINSRLEACTWMRDNYAFVSS